jgi:subtilase family serine protease
MTPAWRRALKAAAATALIAAGLGTAALADTAPVTVTIASAVLPGIGDLTAVGAAPSHQPMDVTVALGGDQTALHAAYQAVYTPGSPAYHHFLTTALVAQQFGASPSRWDAVQSWLSHGGLTVAYASPSRDLIEASGPAAAVESLFKIQLDAYRVGAERFIANPTAPTVPAGLGVTDILGLNTLERAVPSTLVKPGGATSGLGGLLSLGNENIGVQTPQDIWGAYDEPAGDQGAGQTVAMFGEGESSTIVSDLSVFEKHFGFPRVPTTVAHVGPGPFTDTSGSLEWDLDTQSEVGMAPRVAGVKMYFGNSLTDATVATMFSAWQSDPRGPAQADASFGECEANPVGTNLAAVIDPVNNLLASSQIGIGFQNDLQKVAEPVLEKATLEGRTLFSSAGDTGSSCPIVALPVIGAGNGVVNQLVPLTNYPASSPYAVGVGGTVLYTNGSGPRATRASEYAWTFGGGGDSLFIPQPAYQHGVANLDLPCLSTPTGGTAGTGRPCRGVPDVSAMSGDVLTNAYPIVNNGSSTVEGGTSLSSPLWVGMWARVQAASTTGGHGFANEVFYRLGKNPATYARDFFDVTTGLLGVPVVGNGLYPTQTGWDYATGWGTPNLAHLITDANR